MPLDSYAKIPSSPREPAEFEALEDHGVASSGEAESPGSKFHWCCSRGSPTAMSAEGGSQNVIDHTSRPLNPNEKSSSKAGQHARLQVLTPGNDQAFGANVKGSSSRELELGFKGQGDFEKDAVASVQRILPKFLISQPLMDEIKRVGHKEKITVSRTVGPVIFSLAAQNLCTLLTQVAIFVSIISFPDCGENGQATKNVYSYPILLPAWLLRNYVEWRSVQHFLMPAIITRGENASRLFNVGPHQLSAGIWFVIFMVLSNMAFLDVRSDSVIAGLAVTSLGCVGNQFEEAWSKVWKQCIFGYLGMPVQSLLHIVQITWLLSLLQYVMPIFSNMRRKSLSCESSNAYWDKGDDKTIFGDSVHSEDVFLGYADAADMVTIRVLMVENEFLRCESAINKHVLSEGHLRGMVSLSRRLLERLIFSWLLETAVQINVQISFFQLTYYQGGKQLTGLLMKTLGSIALSLAVISRDMIDLYSACSKVFELIWDLSESNDEAKQCLRADHSSEAIMSMARTVRVRIRVLIVSAVVLVCVLIYAVCKLVATFICKDSMWSITGCVDL